MATEIDTHYIPDADWANVTTVSSVSGTPSNGPDAAGTYRVVVGIDVGTITVAAPDAFVLANWSVAGNSNEGELVFTISTLPNRNGRPITKFQYSINSGSDWVDLPAGIIVGTYTATGVTGGTYTDAIMLRAVNSIGNGANSDAKTATVAGAAVNLLPNATFDNSTGLTGAGFSVSGGNLVFSAAGIGSSCRQTPTGAPLAAGDYTWSVTVSGWTAGEFRVSFRSGGGQITTNGADLSGDGVKGGTVSVGSPFDSLWIRIEDGPATFNVENYSLVAA